MKKIKKVMVAITMLVLCFTLSACNIKYASHYKAAQMVTTNRSNKASISFGSFEGTYVMHLRNKSDDEAWISYKATLEDGNIKVFYDFNEEKLDLFEIKSDGSIDGKSDSIIGKKTIYIIIETDGKCNKGSFSFTLENSDH